jgi:hypothetical protein
MTQQEYDIYNWDPLTPEQVSERFCNLRIPWWIAGGWAIDLHVGKPTREHRDTDVLVLREDQFKVQRHLEDWDLYKTNQPGLKPWPAGEFLPPGVNDVWCRKTPHTPWTLQIMMMETDGNSWVFRRDNRISGPLENLGRKDASGLPYVAPEVQLLYKSKEPKLAQNRADFATALPALTGNEKKWLSQQLQLLYTEGHPWLNALGK